MFMINKVKRHLYFFVASYFGFWAGIVLRRWKPRLVVVTGSSGKTTTLHLIEAQLGDKAVYSHHANGAIGIPFHILGMPTNIEKRSNWITHALMAPFRSLRAVPKTKLYIVEADCDRPNEGKFVSRLLNPEVTLWVSVFRTHSMNFDQLVSSGIFKTHEEAIAYEFGYFAENTTNLVIASGAQPWLVDQLKRVRPGVKLKVIKDESLQSYKILENETQFIVNGKEIYLGGLHPKELAVNLQLVSGLLEYLNEPLNPHYDELSMPPGRSSVFAGKKGITIVDSTYNTGLGAMTAIMKLFDAYPSNHKWLVLGDILEQGSLEESEHSNLADIILGVKAERVILLGPRTRTYTMPVLKQKLPSSVILESFESPKEVLHYLTENLSGGEALLFKGGRFLEGVIEQLLENPADEAKLVRREAAWTKRRQGWGLPK
jgi:UDP-N-acetylmuramoyl-tripeptide--D-alanyl-D-alanine ligase